MWEYWATCEAWIDGDTLDATLDLGFHTFARQRLRLLGSKGGVQAPELHAADPAARRRAEAAHERAMVLLPPGAPFRARTARAVKGDPVDGFGRFLAQAVRLDGMNVGDQLLAEGLAAPYRRN